MRADCGVAIVGAGIAGLWTAWRLASAGRPCVLLTKGALADSATAWAQGGIAAAMAQGDSPGLHAADTLAAADGLADPEAVRILTTEGPDRIRDLLAVGAQFDRATDGRPALALEGGHSRPRILHAGGDRTGAALVRWISAVVTASPLVTILEQAEVRRLRVAGGRVVGLELLRAGRADTVLAAAVVLATGGVGQLYRITTNPLVSTGDGWALAYRAAARLTDLEFLQFHPTALKRPGLNPAPLISEAARGAGAHLIDAAGRRFAQAADARGELAPRDIVARAVAQADRAGGAWLDLRHLADLPERFPGLTGMLAAHGIDPAREPVPVAPALHYAMGGIATDLEGRTSVPGLWAVGEVACTGVHGANRLASNSLLEGLVFADRAGRALAACAEFTGPRDDLGPAGPDDDGAADAAAEPVRAEMRRVMTELVGLERGAAGLQTARRTLSQLALAAPPAAWRTRSQLLVARLIARAALRRRESRGGHARLDYPRVPRVRVS